MVLPAPPSGGSGVSSLSGGSRSAPTGSRSASGGSVDESGGSGAAPDRLEFSNFCGGLGLASSGSPTLQGGSDLSSGGFVPPSGDLGSSLPSSSSPKSKSWSAIVENSTSVIEFLPELELKDGHISVSIPEAIVRDAPPLWRNFVLGQFVGPIPHIGKIHAIVNKIWVPEGKLGKIDVNILNDTAVLFRIDDDNVRSWVLKKMYWHIAEVPMVVYKWNPENARKKMDITSIPLWVDFKDVSGHLFSVKGLSYLASVVGKPIKIHPSTVKCTRLDSARVLVEVDLSKPLHSQIHIKQKHGPGTSVSLQYPWIPPRCENCSKWGHVKKTCSTKVNADKATKSIEMIPKPLDKIVGATAAANEEANVAANEGANVAAKEGANIAANEDAIVAVNEGATAAANDAISEIVVDSVTNHQSLGKIVEAKSSKEVISDLISELNNHEEWQVVHRQGGSRSPTRISHTSTLQTPLTSSPSRFELLAEIREEGEINDDDEELNMPKCDLEKKSKLNAKGKTHKSGKKQIVRSKDIALALVSSTSQKKASSRKHS